MQLKKLELFGFKSFPEKTVFGFEPGITAVVGPNGCGKTNVVDAIRWVLGEQSARSLRGARMDDIIFNGTDQRKLLSLGEVSLTFSNCENLLPIEYSEVTVTRRLFRSGESEYLINRIPCRLKDITELFMDTGIGVDSYSVMEQGKVEMIINARPQERRFLFEEAAGITKYKTRKKVALRKLEKTDQNLLRVNDIASEVRRQINSLKRQVGKAKRHRSLSEELQSLETELSLCRYHHLQHEWGVTKEAFEAANESKESLIADISECEAVVEKLKTDLIDIERQLKEVQVERLNLTDEVHTGEKRVSLLKEKISGLESQKRRAEQEILILEEKEASLVEGFEQLQQKRQLWCEECERRKQAADDSEQEQEKVNELIKDYTTAREEKKAALVDFLSREANIHNELGSLESNQINLSKRINRLGEEKIESEKQQSKLLGQLEQIRNEVKEKEERINHLRQNEHEFVQLVGKDNAMLDELRQEQIRQREKLSSLRSNLAILEQLEQKYEGYHEAVKAILERRSQFTGVVGTVADLLVVPSYLETAIESALGAEVQALVITSVEEIENAVNYLKKEKRGRAIFLPLNQLRSSSRLLPMISGIDGIIGFASQLVTCENGYHNLVEYLFGDVIIVRDSEAVRRVQGRIPGIRIVTLEGEIFIAHGSITGGEAAGRDTGLIGRKRRINVLREEVGEAEKLLAKLEAREKKVLSAIALHEQKRENVHKSIHQEEVSLANLQTTVTQVGTEIERLNRYLSVLTTELTEASGYQEETERAHNELVGNFKLLMGEKEAIQKDMAELDRTIAAQEAKREDINRELTELKMAYASWLTEEKNIEQELIRFQKQQKEEQERKETLEAELRSWEEERERHLKEIEHWEQKLENVFNAKSVNQQLLMEGDEKRQQLLAEIAEKENLLRARRKILTGVQDELQELNNKNTNFTQQVTSLSERIYSRYQVDLAALAKNTEEIPAVDGEAAEQRINEIQEKLNHIGPVNLVAIEEYEELEKRSTFLEEQQQDLVSAKQSLLKVITRINRTTRALFMERFNEIAVRFSQLFSLLFGGGKAQLLLMDEDDVLESGIDIVARPPGKKLQNISLLSGGEKAMTAIALLFSLFEVKPSPFCVLDEIDAALDDANIGRFTRMLEKFAEKSQFIIITHNKRTIAAANVMYGITMEESGVSRLVSARLAAEQADRQESTVPYDRIESDRLTEPAPV